MQLHSHDAWAWDTCPSVLSQERGKLRDIFIECVDIDLLSVHLRESFLFLFPFLFDIVLFFELVD